MARAKAKRIKKFVFDEDDIKEITCTVIFTVDYPYLFEDLNCVLNSIRDYGTLVEQKITYLVEKETK